MKRIIFSLLLVAGGVRIASGRGSISRLRSRSVNRPASPFRYSTSRRTVALLPTSSRAAGRHAGGAGRIRFTPPGLNQAFAEIDQVPLPAPQNFDDETKKALREKALGSMPPDSQNPTSYLRS